jgi:hypothetical protein
MEDAEDFDSVAAHAVGDQVRSIGDHQLAGALDTLRAAQGAMLSEQFHRSGNGFHHPGSGGGIIAGDEGGFRKQRRAEKPGEPEKGSDALLAKHNSIARHYG